MGAAARRRIIELAATEVFAEQGYRGAGMDEIAVRSGVTVPVVYEHFGSKQLLHRHLLELHFAELRELWRTYLPGDEPAQVRIARTIDAWFAYVETHPFAWRMLFRDESGDPEVEAIRQEVAAQTRSALLPMIAQERGTANVSGGQDELTCEVLRGTLQGLALWWYEHRDVPREQLVMTVMNALWVGFERVRTGETWKR